MPHIDINDFKAVKSKKCFMYSEYMKLVDSLKQTIEEEFTVMSSQILDKEFPINEGFCNRLRFLYNLRISTLKVAIVFPEDGLDIYPTLTINDNLLHLVNMFVIVENDDMDKDMFNEHKGQRYILHRKVFMSKCEFTKQKLMS